MNASPLVGRARELQLLADLVDHAHERGGALVLRGEAGIGKTALLAAARQRARERGMLIVSAAGVQTEAHLPFAGLHQLVRPILTRLDELPAPQRTAVQAAFGMTGAVAPEPFLIALAALDLLADSAVGASLLLVLDDAHGLDRPSADVLAFVARRLESEPIVMLAASRDGFESPLVEVGLPELRLEGLDESAAGALLDADGELPSQVRRRLLDEAAGNPLALVELRAALGSGHLGGDAELPAWLPLTTRLERAFAVRLPALPSSTRVLLQVAAVDDRDHLSEILGAATLLQGAATALESLEPAVAARLIEVDARDLRFHHPLVRSAVYQAMSMSQRHAAHAALAEVLANHPDRRVWHLAAATVGTDEAVAAELDAAAVRAQRRGAATVAVVAYERAATLSPDTKGRVSRLLSAAELAAELGRTDVLARLTRDVEPQHLSGLDQGRLARIREIVSPGNMGEVSRIDSVVDMAERAGIDGNTTLALSLLTFAAARASWGGVGEDTRRRVLDAAARVSTQDTDPWLLGIMALTEPIACGAMVMERLSRCTPDAADAEAARMLGTAASGIGDYDRAVQFLAVAITGLRGEGRLGLLTRALVMQAWGEVQLGNWAVALSAADEGERLARETRQPPYLGRALLAKAIVAGLRGEETGAIVCIDEAERLARPVRAASVLLYAQQARGLTALGAGRFTEAYDALVTAVEAATLNDYFIERCSAIGYLAEAAQRSDHRAEIRALLTRLEPLAARTPSPGLQVGLRHARALVADDGDAETLFQDAFRPELARWPFAHARLRLAYGAWLRRHRHAAESRGHLRAARDTFDALGAVLWSEQARTELRAAGESSHHRVPNLLDLLTPQELQIARLAADGLSNREIGQQLYLSHRTVSSHLYRIFPKLGITARAELRAALDAGAPASA